MKFQYSHFYMLILGLFESESESGDIVLKLLAPGEENRSLKSKENYIYLMYCNTVINISVGAIAKVNDVFVFHLHNSKKLC